MASSTSKRQAQRRADRIAAFREELDQLAREQILALGEEQRAAVDAHLNRTLAELARSFDIDISTSQKRLSMGMVIVSGLGGLALCAAVFLFFYRIWGLIPVAGQISILAAAPLAGLVATEAVSRRERTPYFTSLLGLLTLAAFVLNLNVLGQIFNLTSSPGAFLAWGLFAIILAYRYRLRLLLAAGLVSLVVFISGMGLSWTGAWWESFYSRPEWALGAGLAILAAPLGFRHTVRDEFPAVYLLTGLLVVFLSMLTLWHSGEESYLPFDEQAIEWMYQVLAFFSAGAAIWAGLKRGWQGVVNLGSAAFAIFLFIKFVEWWWDWMPKYLFFLLVGVLAIGLLMAFRKLRERTS